MYREDLDKLSVKIGQLNAVAYSAECAYDKIPATEVPEIFDSLFFLMVEQIEEIKALSDNIV